MQKFICDYLNEIVILCDGSVTTCCIDPLGANVFGNIIEDSFSTIQNKYKATRKKILNNVFAMPRCRICYNKIRAAGFPKTGTYSVNPTEHEISDFNEEATRVIYRMVIEPTCLCNLKCNGCMQSREDFTMLRKKSRLDLCYLFDWLDEGFDFLENIRFYNYGETFLHPGAIDFCSQVKTRNPNINISIATNGMLLNTQDRRQKLILSGVDELIFSIHGGSQGTVQPYMTRRFDFEKIMSVLRSLVSIKKSEKMSSPKLIWRYLLFSWNDGDKEVETAINLCREIGLDKIVFDTVGFPSPSEKFTPGGDKLRELRRIANL